jgi:hypothetical protein
MNFILYEKVNYKSELSDKEIREALEHNVTFTKYVDRTGKLFVGKVKGLGYLIKNNIFYQNSFAPYCHITLSEGDLSDGTKVKIRYRMHYWILAFMVMFMVPFLLVGVDSLLRFYDYSGLILVLIFFVSYGIMTWGFNKELKKSKMRLITILSLVSKVA